MSRVLNSIKNTYINFIFYILYLITSFLTRKTLLDNLGTELIGLSSTISNIVSFLNLAELGIGTAVSSCLYLPLFKKDTDEINNILSTFAYFYRLIGICLLITGVAFSFFINSLFSESNIPLNLILLNYYSFLSITLLSYFCNFKQIIYSADQKQYKIVSLLNVTKIAILILQCLAVKLIDSNKFEYYLLIYLTLNIAYMLVLQFSIKKEYKWLKVDVSKGKLVYKKYTNLVSKSKQLFFHKISGVILNQTSPVILYYYTTLSAVTLYYNYILIISGVTSLISNIFSGVSGSVGNLVAEGNNNKIIKIYNELNISRIWISSVISIVLYSVIQNLITIWLGSNYILSNKTSLLMILIMYIMMTRSTNEIFLQAYGLFKDIWAPIAESTINITLSIILGYYWGLEGILTGVLISLIVIVKIWKPFFLFNYAFKINSKIYFIKYTIQIIIFYTSYIFSVYITNAITKDASNVLLLIIKTLTITIIYSIISYLILYAFFKEMKTLSSRIKLLLVMLKNKHTITQ